MPFEYAPVEWYMFEKQLFLYSLLSIFNCIGFRDLYKVSIRFVIIHSQ